MWTHTHAPTLEVELGFHCPNPLDRNSNIRVCAESLHTGICLIHAPSWTTLIHPVPVVIEEPLRGTELDLASSALGTLQESGDPGVKYCIHATSELCIAR
jgi:hypothetical protein